VARDALYWLILLYSAVVNIWGSKILPHTNLAAGFFRIVGFVAFLIVLGTVAPKHDARYVFVEFSNSSGVSKPLIFHLLYDYPKEVFNEEITAVDANLYSGRVMECHGSWVY
jgi:hypothetical protein